MSDKKIKYNKKTSLQYGWIPSWFGASEFDDFLIKKIEEFQREKKLTVDGYCGSSTFKAIFTERDAQIDKYTPSSEGKYIVLNGNFFPIEWDKVILWTEDKGLKAKEGNYRKVIGETRDIKLFVNHWDVCLSSQKCQSVLDTKGISVTFLIDNDGCIYQTCDMQHITWHAGVVNNFATGVEISNAYYLKYQSWYGQHGFGERPIVNGTVRGKKLEDHLGFYDIQKKAVQALWNSIANACDIPLRCPIENGKMIDKLYPPAVNGEWRGIIHHFHCSDKKIDCGGFDLKNYIGK